MEYGQRLLTFNIARFLDIVPDSKEARVVNRMLHLPIVQLEASLRENDVINPDAREVFRLVSLFFLNQGPFRYFKARLTELYGSENDTSAKGMQSLFDVIRLQAARFHGLSYVENVILPQVEAGWHQRGRLTADDERARCLAQTLDLVNRRFLAPDMLTSREPGVRAVVAFCRQDALESFERWWEERMEEVPFPVIVPEEPYQGAAPAAAASRPKPRKKPQKKKVAPLRSKPRHGSRTSR